MTDTVRIIPFLIKSGKAKGGHWNLLKAWNNLKFDLSVYFSLSARFFAGKAGRTTACLY
jgi:hypothetical protein